MRRYSFKIPAALLLRTYFGHFATTQNFIQMKAKSMCTPIVALLLAACTAALAKDAEISPSVELREIFKAGEPNAHGFPVNSCVSYMYNIATIIITPTSGLLSRLLPITTA